MKNKEELKLISPLTWAYIGDAVYELYVREYLIKNTKQLNDIRYLQIFQLLTKN